MVSLRYFAPAEPLRGLISSYYLFEADEPQIDDLLRAELAQVRFVLKGRIVSHFATGLTVECPRMMLTGPTSGPVIFQGHGPLAVLGVGLMPVGWATLIGCGADELADNAVAFDSVVGAAAAHTLDRLVNSGCPEGLTAALDALFLDLAARAHAAPHGFARTADDWLMGSRAPRVDDLIGATGLSARQVERLANRVYGASPKLLARKYRALQAAVRIGTGESRGWMDAAGDAFYDQPHFIREFKQFVGMTPRRFVMEGAPVLRLTIDERRKLATLPRLALYS